MLLKSLKTSSFITLDIKLTFIAIQSMCTVLSQVQLSCSVSTLQFKRYMFAFVEILFTDLSLMSNFQSQNLSIIVPLLRSVSTISARSKLQKTGDLPLWERGIHSCVANSSPSTAQKCTVQNCILTCRSKAVPSKIKIIKQNTALVWKALFASPFCIVGEQSICILKTGRRHEHSNNYYMLQSSHKPSVSPNTWSSSSQELSPEVFHCSFTMKRIHSYTLIQKEAVRSSNPYCQRLIDTCLRKRRREAGEQEQHYKQAHVHHFLKLNKRHQN